VCLVRVWQYGRLDFYIAEATALVVGLHGFDVYRCRAADGEIKILIIIKDNL
jgi:hypothetical protein